MRQPAMGQLERTQLRRRWVTANALGELVGLGATFAVGYAALMMTGEAESRWAAVGMGVLLASTGLIEGTVVGLAQHWAMASAFPNLTRLGWWLATLVGALAAWGLGVLPSTIIGMQSGAEPVEEPSLTVVLVLAAALGAVAGPVLALPQWFMLRSHVTRAVRWIPAHSLAWALGMPIIFAAIDVAQRTAGLALSVLVMAVALALTGAVVGTVHGTVLVRMAEEAHPPDEAGDL